MGETRLWEVDHPYRMCEGNFCASGHHKCWDSFDDFISEYGEADIDYNRVHRWDWREGWEIEEGKSILLIYMVYQRKAILQSHEIIVCREDEPAIKIYLQKHWDQEKAIWAPFSAQHQPNNKEG